MVSYFNIQIIVDLDDAAEKVYILHKTGKLPHTPQFLQRLIVLRSFHRQNAAVQVGFFPGALSRHLD